MSLIFGFVLGAFFGATIGVVVMCCMAAAQKGDQDEQE